MNKNINVPLSDHTYSIILGSILGDGSIKKHKGYKNARFSFRHSVAQKEYFLWKAGQLSEISSEKCVFKQKKGDGYGKKGKLRYQSMAMEQLTEIYDLTHKRNKFNIRRKWLNMLTPLSLAIWWLDDGSIISNGRKGVICTDGFTKKQVKSLSQYLSVKWKIKTAVASVKKPQNGKKSAYYRVWFRSTEELKKFLKIILPFIHVKEVLPKVLLLYHDNKLQQRWISEITKNTNFSQALIEKYVNQKKKKWKNFQKKI